MTIQIEMTAAEVIEVARRIGRELTWVEAVGVLGATEQLLHKDRAVGRPRFFQEAVFRVLRKEP
jgi:hypothetical protein